MALFNTIFGQPGGGISGLLGNPAFMLGAGLLGSPDNQLRGALTGLASAQGYKLTEAKLKKDEEEAERQKKLQEMQMKQLQDAQNRQDITRAMMTSANMQPGQFQSPEAQRLLRSHIAGYGVPEMAEQGGLLNPLPTSTELPADARLYEWAKQDPSRMAFLNRNQGASQLPSNVQEWQYYNSLTPEQQKAYLEMKRGGSLFNVGDVPAYRTPGGDVTQLATPQDVQTNKEGNAAATARGTAAGQAQAAAPAKSASITEAMDAIDALRTDPNITAIYGAVEGRVPSVKQGSIDAEAKRDRAVETIALAERGELKGTGPITDFEQKMLRAAKTTLMNPLISDKAALAEADRVYQWLQSKQAAATTILPNSSQAQGGLLGTKPIEEMSDEELRALANGG